MQNQYEGLRFRVAEAGTGQTTGGDKLTHAIMRAMSARMSPFSAQGLRAPGFRALDSYLDELDALVKTVSIAKDNVTKKMKDNMHNMSGRGYQAAATDFTQLHTISQKLSDAQAASLLGDPFS